MKLRITWLDQCVTIEATTEAEFKKALLDGWADLQTQCGGRVGHASLDIWDSTVISPSGTPGWWIRVPHISSQGIFPDHRQLQPAARWQPVVSSPAHRAASARYTGDDYQRRERDAT